MAGTLNSSVDQRGLIGTRKDGSSESMTFAGHQARAPPRRPPRPASGPVRGRCLHGQLAGELRRPPPPPRLPYRTHPPGARRSCRRLEEAVVPSGGLGSRGEIWVADTYGLRPAVAPKPLEPEEELPGQGLFQRVVRGAEDGDDQRPAVQRPCVKGDRVALAVPQQFSTPYDLSSVSDRRRSAKAEPVVAARLVEEGDQFILRTWGHLTRTEKSVPIRSAGRYTWAWRNSSTCSVTVDGETTRTRATSQATSASGPERVHGWPGLEGRRTMSRPRSAGSA